MSQPIVAIRGLTCGYNGHPVLRDIDLAIHAGQFVGVVGPSGAGKTTLIHAILGAIAVPSGTVLVEGEPVRRRPPARVGYVPQVEAVDWNFPVTVEQVVLMGLVDAGWRPPWPTSAERRRVGELLDRLGILETRLRHIRDLSGGQQRRVFLARALIRQPSLLVLDEPTTGADIKTRHEVLHLLAELNRDGMTILLTTHDLNSVAAHLPWVCCLNGRLIAEGHPDRVLTPEILSSTYGSEMVVIRQGGMILVADRTSSIRDVLGQAGQRAG